MFAKLKAAIIRDMWAPSPEGAVIFPAFTGPRWTPTGPPNPAIICQHCRTYGTTLVLSAGTHTAAVDILRKRVPVTQRQINTKLHCLHCNTVSFVWVKASR